MSEVKANFARDAQRYTYPDGSEWEFSIHVNFDSIVRAMAGRAKRSKSGKATALGKAVQVVAVRTKAAPVESEK